MIKNLYKKRNQQTWLFYHYFFLLFGFFGGNLWGSFFSSFYLPPFFFVIGILLCLEILSYIYYKKISLPCSSLPFDNPALPKRRLSKANPGASRSGLGRAVLSSLIAAFRAQRRVPSLCPTDTASKTTGDTSAKHVQQVNKNIPRFKKLSISNGFLPLIFINFQFNKTKDSSKNKMKSRNSFNRSLNFLENRNKSLYLLKVGLVFGLFVDAFKVGS